MPPFQGAIDLAVAFELVVGGCRPLLLDTWCWISLVVMFLCLLLYMCG